jgi:phage shock protein A
MMGVMVLASPVLAQSTQPVPQVQAARGARGAFGGQLFPVQQRGLQWVDQIGAACAELRLDNQQLEQVNSILDAARGDLRNMVQELQPLQPPQRRIRVAAQLNSIADKIKPVLSSQQLQSFEQKFNQLMRGFGSPGPEAQLGPATQPEMAQPNGQQPPRLGVLMERLNDYVSQLELSDEQKAQVQKLFADTRQKLEALREQARGARGGPPAQQAQQVVQNMRQQLASILTTSQAEHLRDLINNGGGLDQPAPNRAGRGGRGARGARGGAEGMIGQDMMPPQPGGAVADAAAAAPDTPEIPLIDIGKDAPDFKLRRLENTQTVELSSLKGKVVLLVFGSYSSPSFRQRAAALETLRQNMSSKISIYTIYTRENYPIGEWNVDRNREEGVMVEQPADLDGRLALAKQAKTTLKLTVPILMDTMDDATAKAYGGLTNAAVLVGRDGKVIAHQKWFEPYTLRRMIDDALKTTPSAPALE